MGKIESNFYFNGNGEGTSMSRPLSFGEVVELSNSVSIIPQNGRTSISLVDRFCGEHAKVEVKEQGRVIHVWVPGQIFTRVEGGVLPGGLQVEGDQILNPAGKVIIQYTTKKI